MSYGEHDRNNGPLIEVLRQQLEREEEKIERARHEISLIMQHLLDLGIENTLHDSAVQKIEKAIAIFQWLHDNCMVPNLAHDAISECRICKTIRELKTPNISVKFSEPDANYSGVIHEIASAPAIACARRLWADSVGTKPFDDIDIFPVAKIIDQYMASK